MEKDQRDLLLEFNAHNVRYLVVGGYALNRYTEPRVTKDLDIFVDISDENAHQVFEALVAFGAPLQGYTPSDFQDVASGFQIGQPPSRVDILMSLSGITFEEAWRNSFAEETGDGIAVRYLSVDDLIKNKLAVGRLQDLADVEALRASEEANRNKEQ